MFGLRTKWEAHGSLYLGNRIASSKCRIWAAPGKKQDLLLRVDDEDVFHDLIQLRNAPPPHFVGRTIDDVPIHAVGLIPVGFTPVIFTATEIQVGQVEPCSSIRFYLPNARISPAVEFVQHPGGSRIVQKPHKFQFPAPLHDYWGEFRQRQDANKVRPRSNSANSSRVMGVLDVTSLSSVVKFDQIEATVYTLFDLLTLACRKRLNWLAARGRGHHGDWWIFRSHIISGWWGKGEFIPIETSDHDTQAMISCLPNLLAFNPEQTAAFRRALHLYLESGPSYHFPVPYYCCAGALEALYAGFCIRNKNDRFLEKVKALCDKYGVACDNSTLRMFRDLRNAAVHGTTTQPADPLAEFEAVRPVEELLSLLLLKVVGYKGRYWGEKQGWRDMQLIT